MKAAGYVYILTNPSFKENIIKIGITSGTVEKRMKELHTTGVPLAFEKYASYATTKYKEVESFMHRSLSLLANNRVNNSREFFRIKPELALNYLMQIAELLGEGEVESCMTAAEIAKTEIIKRQTYQDKEEWLKNNRTEGLREVIDVFEDAGFGYHLGTSDLRIDYKPNNSKKAFTCLMLIGERDFSSFQPSELYKLAEVNGMDHQIVSDFLDIMRPYLSARQKNIPYNLVTGYYNISHDTLIQNRDEIVKHFSMLIK